jgi:cysteine synthase B
MQVYGTILDTIGNTPLVKINKLCKSRHVDIYAKVEGTNPTGSIKDRIAIKMIEQAEAEATLVHGKTIIEPTSGNTGIALANDRRGERLPGRNRDEQRGFGGAPEDDPGRSARR